MFNIKNIVTGAAAGFVLSVCIGLFSSVAVGFVFLRAFVFAVVGAAFGFGIPFLYSKFLNEGGGGDFGSAPEVREGGSPGEKTASSTGGKVDITVDDEVLPEDADGPRFYVSGKTNVPEYINASPTGEPEKLDDVSEKKADGFAAQNFQSASPVTLTSQAAPSETPPSAPASSGFTPVNIASGAEKVEVKATEAAGNVDVIPAVPSSAGGASGGNDALDVLPDIGDLNFGSKKNANNDTIVDSEFASDGSSKGATIAFPNGESAADKNTNEMAMAIRTLLAKDN